VSAGNSLIGECADCCVCDAPTIFESVLFFSLCGFRAWDDTDRYFSTATVSGSYGVTDPTTYSGGGTRSPLWSTACTQSGFAGISTTLTSNKIVDPDMYGTCTPPFSAVLELPWVESARHELYYVFGSARPAGCSTQVNYDAGRGTDLTTTATAYTRYRVDGSATITLSGEYTTSDVSSDVYEHGTFGAFGYGETAYSSNFGSGGRASRYKLAFKIPSPSTCYKAKWIERFIPDSGVGITSLEIISHGVYRPAVSISSPPSGGTLGLAMVSMSSTGTVESIKILNPGLGYIPQITFSGGEGNGAEAIAIINSAGAVTSVVILDGGRNYTSAPVVSFTDVSAPRVRAVGYATISQGRVTGITITTAGDFRPTVTVSAATGGGTSSINWVCTLDPSSGMITSITGGTAGDYLPTVSISGGGGSGATVAITMDEQGGIASASLTAAGSGFASEPYLIITQKNSNTATSAVIHLHLGTETEKCEVWNKVVPVNYNPSDNTTWPTFPSADPGYFKIALPSSKGVTTVENVRVFCDCSTC
jgi:hypothetical protein